MVKQKINSSFLLMAFAMLYITADLASNVVLYKQVKLGPGLFPGGVFVVPFIYCLSDVITETLGYKTARAIVWLGIFCDFVFVFFVEIIIRLPSPSNWHMQAAFDSVLGSLFRANVASVAGIILGSFINIYLLSKWKVLLSGKYFWLRSIGACAIAEAVVLCVALPILFIGVISFQDIIRMIISEYILRMGYAVVITVPASIFVYYIKKYAHINTYDVGINYNPFKLSLD